MGLEIKVTKISDRWHARMVSGDDLLDEMACELRSDIGWICREMLRWHQKLGGCSGFADAARARQTTGANGRIWWRKDLHSNAQLTKSNLLRRRTMREAKFFRKKNVIRGAEGDKVFPSVNKAKKESRSIQAANGGMGCGVLRVVEKLPPLPEAEEKKP